MPLSLIPTLPKTLPAFCRAAGLLVGMVKAFVAAEAWKEAEIGDEKMTEAVE